MNPQSFKHYDILIAILSTLGVTGVATFLANRTRRLVREHGKFLINGIFWILERSLTRSLSATFSMKRYCIIQLADDSGRFLQVPGAQNRALDVDDVFVPLTLELGGGDKTFTSANLLDAGNRLIVVGDPGSGKSTLVKRIFRDSCYEMLSQPSSGRLPIRLELKGLAPPQHIKDESDAGNWLMKMLRTNVSNVKGFEMGRLFDSWSVDAGLLILLDGLDEVSSDKYPIIAAAIRGLSRLLTEQTPKSVVILTMRIQFHQQVRHEFEEVYPQTMYVRQFLPNEIFTFLNKWPFGKNQDAEDTINRIYADLTDRPTLREMCSNPLILAMYVENHSKSGRNEVPDTRTQFYEKVVTELLINRRRRQDLVTSHSIGLRNQREEVLGELALDNLLDASQPANALSWKKALSVTSNVCGCGLEEAGSILRELASETGLISEDRPGESIRFIHLTFCEFLAARQCAEGRENGWETVINKHRSFVRSEESYLQTRLVEVLPFAHALLPRVRQSAALSDVASLNDRLVLGRCFLETQLYGHSEWTNYLRDERKFLASSGENEWDESRVRRLHLFSAVVRDVRDWHAEVIRVNVVPELDTVFTDIVKGNREILAKVFATYASQDAAAAVRLSQQVGIDMLIESPQLLVHSCQEEPFLAYAQAGLKEPSSNLWSAILVESALRYSNVAYRLNRTKSFMISFSPEMARRNKRLVRLGLVSKGSLYEALLLRVLSSESTDSRLPAVRIVKACTRRSTLNYFIYHLRYLICLTSICGLLLLFGLIAGFTPVEVQNYIDIPLAVLAMLITIGIFTVSYDIEWVHMAILDFVRPLDREHGRFHPGQFFLKLQISRRLISFMQVDSLVEMTSLRQVEPYPIVRYLYPTQGRG